MKLIKGDFFEHQTITVEIDGKQVNRKVRYSRMDGLYIVYQNKKYFQYECNFDECYKKKELLKVYDLYCNGDKIGTALFWNEVQEMKREYKKTYNELGWKTKFEVIEV